MNKMNINKKSRHHEVFMWKVTTKQAVGKIDEMELKRYRVEIRWSGNEQLTAKTAVVYSGNEKTRLV